jgi:hypothetical protein
VRPPLSLEKPGPVTVTPRPVQLLIEISRQQHGILMQARLLDETGLIDPDCRAMIHEDLRVFASRASAELRMLEGDWI